MAFCEKCGGIISPEMKYCDKCGSAIVHEPVESPVDNSAASDVENETTAAEVIVSQGDESHNESELNEIAEEAKISKEKINFNVRTYVDNFISSLPPIITQPGSRIMRYCGFGGLAVSSAMYLICFFLFMADIAFVVGCRAVPNISLNMFGASTGKIGAGSIWMVIYFAINLLPVALTMLAFLKPHRKYFIPVAPTVCFMLSIFSLIAWGLCNAGNFTEAITIYPTFNAWGTFAWYCLVDSLSELWYIKIPFALISGVAFGIDYIINNKKRV